MGLDAVELVIEVEEEFGVAIPDEEAGCMITLGHLHDYLLEANGRLHRSPCLTQGAFYRIRRAMVDTLGVDRCSIRPSTALLPLLGESRRWKKWRQIENALALRLPYLLDRTGAGVAFGGLVGATCGFTLAITMSGDPFVGAAGALLGVNPGVFVGWLVGRSCRPLVAPAFATVGQLSRCVVTLNADQLRAPDELPAENDPIWERLSTIVARQFDVPRETLTRRTEFVKDLGC
jgi:hypothetical protein